MKQFVYVNFYELVSCLIGLRETTENVSILEQEVSILRVQVRSVTNAPRTITLKYRLCIFRNKLK